MTSSTPTIDLTDSDLLAEARRYSMQIAWSPEDEVYIVSVPELPGLHTHGATPMEAAEMGEEAIALWLAGLRWRGQPVPPPPRTARRTVVDKPPAYDAARIRRLRHRLRLSQPVFAGTLNVSPATVKAWEQGKRRPAGASLRLLELAEKYPSLVVGVIAPRIKRVESGANGIAAAPGRRGRPPLRSEQRMARSGDSDFPRRGRPSGAAAGSVAVE